MRGGGIISKSHIKRTLVELAILFVATTMFRVIQPYLGLSFAIILSFASLENKLYSKNYIKENIKYISILIILSILYVITVWSIVFLHKHDILVSSA